MGYPVSRSHLAPDVAGRDRIELAGDRYADRPTLDDIEPADFDDVRMTDRHGPAGGFFASETNSYDDDWEAW